MDGLRQVGEPEAGGHGERHFADHLAGVTGDQCGAQNAPARLVRMDASGPLVLTIEDGSVDLVERPSPAAPIADTNPAVPPPTTTRL